MTAAEPAAPPEARRESTDLSAAALVAVLAGVLLVLAGYGGGVVLLAAVALLQAVLLVSWVFGTGMPGRLGGLVLGAAAGAAADTLVMVFQRGQLGTVLPVLGLAVLVPFVHQLTRGVVRNRVVESLSDTALLVVSVVSLASVIELFHAFGEVGSARTVAGGVLSGVVGAAAVALAIGLLVDVVAPVPRFDPAVRRGLLATLVGGAVGAALGYTRLHSAAAIEFAGGRGAFVGVAVGLVVGLLGVGASFAMATVTAPAAPAGPWPARLRVLLTALVPLALVSPIGYMLCLAIRA